MSLTETEKKMRGWYPDRVGRWTRAQWEAWFKRSGISVNEIDMDQMHRVFEFAGEPPYAEENEFGPIIP